MYNCPVIMLVLMPAYVFSILRMTDIALHRSMVSCLENIIHENFLSRSSAVISVSYDTQKTSDMSLIDMTTKMLNDIFIWPLVVSNSGVDFAESDIVVLQSGYIIFLWSEDDGSNTESLQSQLDILSANPSWNPRGKFLVAVPNTGNETGHTVAFRICDILWDFYRISNVIVVTPYNTSPYVFDIYSAFPYREGSCGKVNDVIKVDQCSSEQSTFFKGDLFPNIVPTNFNKCPVVISTVGLEPYLIHKENFGSNLFTVDGLGIELLKISAEKMNFTPEFLEPIFTTDPNLIFQEAANVQNGVSEVLAGATPLIANTVAFFDGTIPFIFDSINWFVPCPKPIPRMERVFSVFTVSSWLAMGAVQLLTSVVFCCARGCGRRREQLSEALLYTWAVMMGLSFLHVPKLLHLRILLILFIFYCFTVSMVFQTYFASYLVEPGYGKRLQSMDDLVESGFIYGYIKMAEMVVQTMEYSELKRFESRRVECKDLRSCTEQIMSKGNLISTISYNYATYVASLKGVRHKSQALCYLEEPIISAYACVLLRKGSPLLYRLNQLFRRCLEAGLLNRYWTDLTFRTNLENIENIEDESDTYFVFSMEHLGPIFWLLICGYGLSFIIFLWEFIFWNYFRFKYTFNQMFTRIFAVGRPITAERISSILKERS